MEGDVTVMAGKKEIFREANISINDNVLVHKNMVVQLSSISLVEVAPMPKEKYPPIAIIGMLVGVAFLKANVVLAIIIMIGFAFWLYKIYEINASLGKYLILELNSGRLLLFSCNDVLFLNRVVEVIKECFSGNGGKWFINFGNYQIGDNNTIQGER